MRYWDIIEGLNQVLEAGQSYVRYQTHNYVFEARPPSDADIKSAFKILELPYGDKTDLEKNYKALARKNHPDLGGSHDAMREINWAKDVLDAVGSVNQYKKHDWEAQKEYEQKQKQVFDELWKNIEKVFKKANPVYEEYLSQYFPDIKGENFIYNAKSYGGRGSIKWATPDAKTIFEINLWLSSQSGGLGTGSMEDNITVSYGTELFNDNRKYKIKSSDFRSSRLTSELLDPRNPFPEAAVKRIASKTRAGSKMQRRDFVGALEHEFKAKYVSKDTWQIPIDDEWTFDLYRIVLMRQGVYMTRFMYKNKKFVPLNAPIGAGSIDIAETPEGLEKLHKIVAFLKKDKDLVAAAKKFRG